MKAEELHSRVLGICRDVLGVANLEIEDHHRARDIPNYDSLKHIEILVRCQQVFGIALTALEAGQIASFGSLKELVGRKVMEKG